MPEAMPEVVRNWLEEHGHGAVTAVHPVGGGCINNGARLVTRSGESFFLKTNPDAPAGMFACEVEGLIALKQEDGPRVPQPYLHGNSFLLMEDLKPAAPQPDYWPEFGRRLAALHNHTHSHFGFHQDNYLGSTPQPNPWTEDGYEFFGEHRILFQVRLAVRRGLLGREDARRAEKLVERLPELIPPQPPSLIHGDLWSGNAITGPQGEPALIDPAVHYGWAEAELAMTALFGSFPPAFYRAYEEVRPLASGYARRYPLYNLYHLLNHLNLFGSGYLRQVQGILRQFE